MMLITILFIPVLIVLGYVSAVCYVQNYRWRTWKAHISDFLPVTRNRLVYLIVSVVLLELIALYLFLFCKAESITAGKYLLLLLLLLPIAAVDYKVKKIPNAFLLAGLIIRVVLGIVEWLVYPSEMLGILKDCGLGFLIIGFIFLMLSLIFKNGLGMGDVKLFALLGLYLGLLGGVAGVIFFSLVAAFFTALFLLIFKKKKRKDVFAFGPCVLLGTVAFICLSAGGIV